MIPEQEELPWKNTFVMFVAMCMMRPPGTLESQAALDQAARWGTEPTDFQRSADRTHIFTHIQWNLRCCRIVCRQAIPAFRWMTAEEIRAQVPLPTAFRQFLDFL